MLTSQTLQHKLYILRQRMLPAFEDDCVDVNVWPIMLIMPLCHPVLRLYELYQYAIACMLLSQTHIHPAETCNS